jgi:hypothetical protein
LTLDVGPLRAFDRLDDDGGGDVHEIARGDRPLIPAGQRLDISIYSPVDGVSHDASRRRVSGEIFNP